MVFDGFCLLHSFCSFFTIIRNVVEAGYVSYDLGGWAPPIGIEYRVDYLNGFLLVLVSGMAFLTSIYMKGTIDLEIEKSNQTLFFTCFLLCVSGLLGVLITGDAFNLLFFRNIFTIHICFSGSGRK